jgi:ankyrin repeat protein
MQTLFDAGTDINAVDDKNSTALMLAASRGEDDIVRFLLDLGADVNIRSKVLGTAIEAARATREKTWTRPGIENVILMLLEACARG